MRARSGRAIVNYGVDLMLVDGAGSHQAFLVSGWFTGCRRLSLQQDGWVLGAASLALLGDRLERLCCIGGHFLARSCASDFS